MTMSSKNDVVKTSFLQDWFGGSNHLFQRGLAQVEVAETSSPSAEGEMSFSAFLFAKLFHSNFSCQRKAGIKFWLTLPLLEESFSVDFFAYFLFFFFLRKKKVRESRRKEQKEERLQSV